jgi:PAS domain S-box-containing protein
VVLPDAPRFTIVTVSNDYALATGLSKEDLKGRGIGEAWPVNGEDPELTGAHVNGISTSLERVLTHKQPQIIPALPYAFPNGNGTLTVKHWRTHNTPVLDEAGTVRYIIHTVEDISGQVAAEQREGHLLDMEKAYNVFLAAPVVIGIVKGDNYIIDLANEGLLEIWGRSAEVIGKPLLEAIPELRDQGFIELLDAVRLTGQSYYATEAPIRLVRNGVEQDVYMNFVYKAYYEHKGQAEATAVIAVGHDVTEQVLARKVVEESEAKYRTLFDTMAQGFCILEIIFNAQNEPVDYRFLETNPVFEQQTGLKNAVGKTALELVPNLERHWFDRYGKVALTGEALHFTEGSEAMGKWFEVHAFRTGGSDSRKVALIFSDISEHKKNEETEERARLAVASAELGTFDLNLVTNELIASERMQAIFGVDSLTERERYLSAIHPDDRAQRIKAYEVAYQTGSLEYEARVIHKEGEIRWIRVKGKIYFDTESKPLKLLGVVQDITEEKEFAEELKKQVRQQTAELVSAHQTLLNTNTYFQSIINQFDASMAALVPIFEEGHIVDFYFKMTNEAYAQYSLLSPEAIKGKRVSEVFPGYYQTDAFDRYVEVYHSGKAQNWELHYNVDGINAYLLVNASRMADEVVVDFSDVSELKNLQLDLLLKVQELERSNKNLEEFAYAASHDLKEPVRKIQFFADRLKSELGAKLSEAQGRLFERMESAAQRMGVLIDDLLSYSYVSKGIAGVEEVDLYEKVQKVLEDLELEIDERAARVNVAPLPRVQGHQRQLQQLFQNLVGNALKYQQAGTPPVINIKSKEVLGKDASLPVREEDTARKFYLIEVADNGIGFDQSDAERIFNVFTRLHGKTEYNGSGIGLSIVRKVVENHNGYIWAESEPGNGATFKVMLPVQ